MWVGVERGHRRQEQGPCCRKPVAAGVGWCGGPWAGRTGCPSGAKKGGRSRVPAATYYSAREEGTSGASTLREESRWHPTYLHHVTGVSPININIGKFHCRVTMWPCSCCKTTTPIMLGQVGMMGAVIWQQLQSHTGFATLLSPYRSVALPEATAANPPIPVSQQTPHNSVTADPP